MTALLLLCTAAPAGAVEGVTAVLEDVLQVPSSAGSPPLARINVLREVPDGSGRLFVNDLEGPFYVIDGPTLLTYMDLSVEFEDLKTSPGKASGFVSFAFHPEFATNGLFYTAHTEFEGAIPPNLGTRNAPFPSAFQHHAVLTEWAATDPAANAFSGTSRELLRIGAPFRIHNLQEIAFDPTALPSDPDYGLLYVGSGDFGTTEIGEPEQLQRLDTPYGAVLRIDPLGGPFLRDGIQYDYGIPPGNPYASDADPDTLDEIYVHGVRNNHRLIWDVADGTLFGADIGQDSFEEINVLVPGRNNGWPLREGTSAHDPDDPGEVSSLPPDDASFGFTYPVLQYDHGEGDAIAGGVVYRGGIASELQGQLVFGDLVTGRIYYADAQALKDADDGDPTTLAPFHELALLHDGQSKTLLEIVRDATGDSGIGRTDLRFGADASGEIYVTTKQDGTVRRLVPLPACSDGADNDADGLADHPSDPGCSDPTSNRESPRCDDDVDNDGDGKIDFDGGPGGGAPDPNCSSAWDNRERVYQTTGCGIGPELVLLLPLLYGVRRRSGVEPAPPGIPSLAPVGAPSPRAERRR